MKIVKFKKNKIGLKEKIIFTIGVSLILCVFITNIICIKLTSKILDAADLLIQKENHMILKEAFGQSIIKNIDTSSIIKVIKNSNGEIVEVDFNIRECEKLLMIIINYMNKATNGYNTNGYIIYVPLGYLSDSPLLINTGPKIPINAKTTDIAMGNLKTVVKEYGINNALVEIYLEIALKVDTIIPLERREQNITYESLIASKIVVGKVPNFYNGTFTNESRTINLPIDE